MALNSNHIRLRWMQNSLILEKVGSTTVLQISQEDSSELRTKTDFNEFSTYFKETALKNREARRTLGAWERKEPGLLRELFEAVSGN